MWSSGRRVLQLLCRQEAARSFSVTPVQKTIIVERCWQVPLAKIGSPPRLQGRRHRIYRLVENTKDAPKQKLELILTQTVPKLGGRGDTVFVKKCIGRNRLLPEGLAVYASPENKQMFAEELRLMREGSADQRIQTRTGEKTVEFLKSVTLKINKMPSDEFKLTKEVVCRQFLKKLGVVVPPHALTLPDETITDLGDYWCEVKVNRMDAVRIPMSVLPYEDPSAEHQRLLKAERQRLAAAAEAAGEDQAVVKADSEAAAEVAKDSCEGSEAAASAQQTETTETSQDSTAAADAPSDGLKKE